MDAKRFTELVKEYNVLYDMSNGSQKDGFSTKNAWLEIVSKLPFPQNG